MKFERSDIPTLADEYVLGLLESAEAAEVEAEMEKDAGLMAAVAASRERFLPLDTAVDPVAVGGSLWEKIESQLPARQTVAASPSLLTPANENKRNGWRGAAISAIAACLLLSAGLAFSLMRTVEPLVIAVLVNESGEVQAVVEDFGNENASVRLLADFSVPLDKTIQVWTLPSREMGPVSLGLIEDARSVSLSGPSLPRPQNGQLYELTLENTGGSPTGRPTGPILAKGFAKMPR
ncbi:anti-sigma factor domain-containing protein [Agrobacterium tumefaciens]|uniref:anti-sigma factor n=1 Tax=Agrobacterium tumefaciens TaxID=358 RepID=UPI00287EE35A|nr:anti-sigma factor [Agrobacterium tumefaciens]MDS7595318.1 anti-sigma factor [Agrobacterium tumefaciens]